MLQKIIARAKEFGFDDIEIIVSSSEETRISVFKGNVESNFSGSEESTTLKGFINNKAATLRFQKNSADLTDEEIDNLLEKLKENVLAITTKEEAVLFSGSDNYPVIEKKESNFDKVSTQEKINLLLDLEKKGYAVSEKVELIDYLRYNEEKTTMKIVNSKGLNLAKENEIGVVVFGCVCGEKDNPNKQNGFAVKAVNNYNDFDVDKIYKKGTTNGLSMIGATQIPTGNYKVIIEKDCMIDLLSGFFSMFSGESVLRKITGLIGKENEKIMSEKISIVDNPLKEDALIREPFDAEGVATFKKDVVRNGVFKGFLHNLKTAKALGSTTTGNASASGVRAMNFHIENGDTSLDDMIKEMDEGLLITDLAGLHASLNAISGDFSGQASGYYIKDGKKVHPVCLVVVAGNFLKMMSDVEKIGNDLEVSYSGFGSPSIQFGKLPVSGK